MVEPSLEEKNVVVTGANGRLGRAVVRAFLDEGARLAAVVRTEEKAKAVRDAVGGRTDIFTADFTREDEVDACFNAIGSRFQSIDAVIHTVGMWTETPFVNTSLEEWHRVLSVNLTSTWLCFQHAASLMETGGCLITFSSAQGADRGQSRQAAYSAAKAGVVRLVETAAREFADRRITAHAIAPSFIRYGESAEQQGVDASEVASLCTYLCGSRGEGLNGSTVRMYGTKL